MWTYTPNAGSVPERRSRAAEGVMSVVQLQRGHGRLLGDLHATDLLHALLPLLLAVEELALARDVTAVALGDHVLALGLNRLAGDDAPADRRLDRYVEQLARDELAQL